MPDVRRMKAKLALMGEGGVGKTSLIRRFVLDEYEDSYLHTIGTKVSKIQLTVPYGDAFVVQVDVSIFDIMGQRGFRDMVRETYFHGVQGLLAVCDLTRQDSIAALEEWIPAALEVSGPVPIRILANKKDLAERRVLPDSEIHRFADAHGATFILTSARTGEGVDEAFNGLAVQIVDDAVRKERTQVTDRGVRERILLLLAKRGALGVTRGQFLEVLRGLKPDSLIEELSGLEDDGLVVLGWQGPSDFTARLTDRGVEEGRRVVSPLEEA
jgi:small GTP-binding protein